MIGSIGTLIRPCSGGLDIDGVRGAGRSNKIGRD